jgi:hypothetical protein
MVPCSWLYPPSLESYLGGKDRKHDKISETRYIRCYLKLVPTAFNNYVRRYYLEQSLPTVNQHKWFVSRQSDSDVLSPESTGDAPGAFGIGSEQPEWNRLQRVVLWSWLVACLMGNTYHISCTVPPSYTVCRQGCYLSVSINSLRVPTSDWRDAGELFQTCKEHGT